ncbi:hypothetical protein LCGC14_3004920 [marine sediment metagenome]|uniref:DUF7352 domain-containing protein n=1 Tax=marine sediment metagenome TaxID=412755 RepID=A0A0F8ZR52_9ZZZZ
MKEIWKYTLPLTDYPVVSMQKGARVLSVGVQHGEVQVWALVDPEAPTELRRFRVAGTGHPLEDEIASMRFIGTVQMGAFVWHIFEDQEAEA